MSQSCVGLDVLSCGDDFGVLSTTWVDGCGGASTTWTLSSGFFDVSGTLEDGCGSGTKVGVSLVSTPMSIVSLEINLKDEIAPVSPDSRLGNIKRGELIV